MSRLTGAAAIRAISGPVPTMPTQMPHNDARRGLVQGIAAYVTWGTVPVYWRLMAGISPIEILAHRVVWGVVALVLIARLAGAGPAVRAGLASRRTVAVMALSGTPALVN